MAHPLLLRLALAFFTLIAAGVVGLAGAVVTARAQDAPPSLEHPIARPEGGAPQLPSGGRTIDRGGSDDRVRGGRGDDLIRSRRGDDRVTGGRGDDALFGGSGDDRLVGGSGDDLIVDTQGHDRIAADGTTDRVASGPGDDRINVRDGRPGDRVTCGPGNDTVVADRGDRIASDCELVIDGTRELVRPDARRMSAAARRDFVAAVKQLKLTPSPYDATINWYDQFVAWHDEAFADAAHGSPAFLPWHRQFLLLFEGALQTVSGKPIALPYWDWTDQASTDAVFSDELMGPNGDPTDRRAVTSGPFRKGEWRIWVRDPAGVQPLNPEAGVVGREAQWIVRSFGAIPGFRLPTRDDVDRLLGVPAFDAADWDMDVAGEDSFRNAFEGWGQLAPGAGSHNSVHVWTGGDVGTMGKTTSPNDPVFWLHHANVDRVWEQWARRNGHGYLPSEGAREGGNLRDAMSPFRGAGIRAVPEDLLRTEGVGYVYDDLPSEETDLVGTGARASGVGVSFGSGDAAAAAGLLCVLPS